MTLLARLLAFAAWLGPATAWAVEERIVQCARALLASREHHLTPSISDAHTRAAVMALGRFRAHNLNEFDFLPGDAAGVVGPSAPRWRRARLARRLSAVIDEGSIAPDDASTGAPARQVTRGTWIEGERDVGAFIERLTRAEPWSEGGSDALASEKSHRMIVHPAVTAALGALQATHFAGPPMSAEMHVFAFACLVATRHLPEASARGVLAYAWEPSLGTRLRRWLDAGTPGWLAASANLRLPTEVATRLWATGELAPDDVVLDFHWRTYPRWTARLIGHGPGAYALIPQAFRPRVTWLRVDAVVTRTAPGAKPTLIYVTRVTEELPRYLRRTPAPRENRARRARTAPGW